MNSESTGNGRRWPPGPRFALILAILAFAGVAGVLVGNSLAGRDSVRDEAGRIDEYQGLGERTGLTGELALAVEPMSLAVQTGQPITVNLNLTNTTRKKMILNGWLTPVPAELNSNQMPIQVQVSREGRKVGFQGNSILLPPHTEDDFFVLEPGKSKVVQVDLSRTASGVWNVREPGDYAFEVWYETYLTGKYVGVKAWTGMTNHVVVQVRVQGVSAN